MPKLYKLSVLPIPEKMVVDMQTKVDNIIKIKKEIDKAVKTETNGWQNYEKSFDSDNTERLNIQNIYNLD